MSFYTSLSGLRAAQTDLSVASNNVANVGTIGFKRSRAEFGDLISASPLQTQTTPGLGTRLKAIEQQFGQGDFQTSERSFDLAISGQGFFITRDDAGGGEVSYTRNGAFGLDRNRNVTDQRGAFLQVLPVDSQGIVTATGLSSTRNLQVPLTSGVSRATSTIDLAVTFPNSADLPAERSVYGGGTNYAFDRYDLNSYNFSTATSAFDAQGNELPATIYYTRTSAPSDTNPGSTWEARMFVGNTQVSDPTNPVQLTFDANGVLTAPTGPVSLGTSQPAGATAPLTLALDFSGGSAMAPTQFSLRNISQDGFAAGQLDDVSVGADGLVTASYSNGDAVPLGKLALANFPNPTGLRQLGNSSWGATGSAGQVIVDEPGKSALGGIQTGALEEANVDITEELVALISAQRNFQANAKAIETANQLTQSIVQIA